MELNDKLSKKVQSIQPSGIRKFFDLANQLQGVISLGVGEPDFDTPWHIREAAIYAIESGRTTYTENAGLLNLREEICKYQKRHYGLTYDAKSEVLVSVGGSEAIDVTLRALLNEGDGVIVPTPTYVAYEPAVVMAGGKVQSLVLRSEDNFKVTPEGLRAVITDKTKVLILNYPSNPTGEMMCKLDYEALIPIILEYELIVISDEIYSDLIYDGEHVSPAAFDEIRDQVLIINGCSKAMAMTGWRIGYVLGNSTLIAAITKIHQYIIMCAPIMSQYAALQGLKHADEDIEKMRQAYLERRNYIVHEFNRIGLKTRTPKGAFYIFPDIRSTGLSSEDFCEALLNAEKVACVPGTAFGEAGEGFIRVSYAYSIDEIKQAIERIERFMKQFK